MHVYTSYVTHIDEADPTRGDFMPLRCWCERGRRRLGNTCITRDETKRHTESSLFQREQRQVLYLVRKTSSRIKAPHSREKASSGGKNHANIKERTSREKQARNRDASNHVLRSERRLSAPVVSLIAKPRVGSEQKAFAVLTDAEISAEYSTIFSPPSAAPQVQTNA